MSKDGIDRLELDAEHFKNYGLDSGALYNRIVKYLEELKERRSEAKSLEVKNGLGQEMTDADLIAALRRNSVETGSVACLGCGYEHNCGIKGCAVLRAAADRLERLSKEDTDTSDELKPCPRCGGEAKYFSNVFENHAVHCENRKCGLSTRRWSKTKKEAKEIWNSRTMSDHIVVATKKVGDNPPLTLEELRGMGDELVWMEDWYTGVEEKEGYGFERASDVLTFEGWRHTTNYGKMWRAYRRKPEKAKQ